MRQKQELVTQLGRFCPFLAKLKEGNVSDTPSKANDTFYLAIGFIIKLISS